MKTRLYYLVQPFCLKGNDLVPIDVRECTCATEAEALGAAIAPRHAAVIVYMVEGNAEANLWDEPEILATHGAITRRQLHAA